MKKLIALITLFVLTVSPVALATSIIFEPFDYAYVPGYLTTNLVGHSTVDGNAWFQAGGGLTNIPGIVPGNLSVTGLAPSYGNSCHFGGIAITNGMAARLNLPNNMTNGSIFYSFIVKITDITGLSTSTTNSLGTNGVFFVGLNNTTGSQSGVPTIIFGAVTWRTNNTAAGGYQIGINKKGGDTNNIAWDPNPHQQGDQLFIVGTYDYLDGGPGTGTADTSRMWINPDPSTFEINPEPTGGTVPSGAPLVSTGAADVTLANGGIQSFCLMNRSANEPKGITVDEIMIGTTWADVTLTNVPLALNSNPKNAHAIVGGSVSFSVTTLNASIYQWQHNDVDIPTGTTRTLSLTNVQLSDAGSYRVKVSNTGAGPLTSAEATLTIFPDIYPRLVPLWSLAPGSRPYLTTDSTSQPNQRCFAYNSFSNQVLLVSRTNSLIPSAFYTNNIWVLNGDTGADLYQMNVDPTVVNGGLDISGGGGTNIGALNYIDVASDAAVFAGNLGNAGTGTAQFKLYRWPTSDPNAAPVNVWAGDPSGQSTVPRFGDSLTVRGSGNDVEVMLDSQAGTAGSLLNVKSGGSVLNPGDWAYHYFANAAGGQSGGRTLLYSSSGNTFWEKHGATGTPSLGNLVLLSYDTNTQTSTILTNIPNVASNPNLVAFNSATNMLFIINDNGSASSPNTLDQYDLADPSNPLFVRSYNFPVNQKPNSNGYGRVAVSGDRVYALDANNGMVAFRIEPVLSISQTDSTHVQLAWSATTTGYTLYSTHDLTTPFGSWNNLGTGTQSGQQFVISNTIGSQPTFYRLQKPQ